MWKSIVLRKNVVLYKKIFFKRRGEHAVTILFITLNIFPREELQRPVWRQRQFHILVLPPCAKTNLEDDFHETCFTCGTVSQFHTDGASRPQWLVGIFNERICPSSQNTTARIYCCKSPMKSLGGIFDRKQCLHIARRTRRKFQLRFEPPCWKHHMQCINGPQWLMGFSNCEQRRKNRKKKKTCYQTWLSSWVSWATE